MKLVMYRHPVMQHITRNGQQEGCVGGRGGLMHELSKPGRIVVSTLGPIVVSTLRLNVVSTLRLNVVSMLRPIVVGMLRPIVVGTLGAQWGENTQAQCG